MLRSNPLSLDVLGKLTNPVIEPVDERIERLGLAIRFKRMRLVVEFLENLTELSHGDEVLRLKREHPAQRIDGVLIIVLLGGKSCPAVPSFSKIRRDVSKLVDDVARGFGIVRTDRLVGALQEQVRARAVGMGPAGAQLAFNGSGSA